MCCFSVPTPATFWHAWFAPKVHVSATNIFARATAPGIQGLAYSMNLATKQEVAMVLPVPVRPNAGENALRFIDLHEHAQMFDDLAFLFEMPQPQPNTRAMRFRMGRPTKITPSSSTRTALSSAASFAAA